MGTLNIKMREGFKARLASALSYFQKKSLKLYTLDQSMPFRVLREYNRYIPFFKRKQYGCLFCRMQLADLVNLR